MLRARAGAGSEAEVRAACHRAVLGWARGVFGCRAAAPSWVLSCQESTGSSWHFSAAPTTRTSWIKNRDRCSGHYELREEVTGTGFSAVEWSRFHPCVAPITCAVFPLMKKPPALAEKEGRRAKGEPGERSSADFSCRCGEAKALAARLRQRGWNVLYDEARAGGRGREPQEHRNRRERESREQRAESREQRAVRVLKALYSRERNERRAEAESAEWPSMRPPSRRLGALGSATGAWTRQGDGTGSVLGRAMAEVGTPFCCTVDFDTLEEHAATRKAAGRAPPGRALCAGALSGSVTPRTTR